MNLPHLNPRGAASRVMAAAILLMLSVCTACAGPGNRSMQASEVFPDVRSAELAEAAADGNAARVRELAAAGANPNARGAKGTTPLQWALYHHSSAGLEALLGVGADPAVGSDDGMTVMHLAAMANDPRYLRVLLERGANPDTPNTVTQATPLAAALMGERAENFKALLAAGAKPDLADRMGNTPLHQAAKVNEFGHALSLLQAGASPNARNVQGASFQRFMFMTPEKVLNGQTRREREAVIEWLREHQIPIEDAQAK
ncbi:ankyrin repeat family protein [Lysobacter antibioticus]|nr:ankyrin repeat family protein [Lysobacter antibioticus]